MTTYSEEDEVIVKLQLQGMDELLLAIKSRNVVVPISSITILEPADIHGGFSRYKVGDFLEQHRGKENDRLLFKNVHHKQAALDGKVIVIT